jgi:cold shock CspA family protein
MSKLRHRVMLAVVVACGICTVFSVDRNYRPIAQIDPSQGPTEFAGLPQEPIVPSEPCDDVRKAEQSRRAVRPAGDPKRKNGLNYEGVLKGQEGGTSLPKPAEPMPPTYCRSIERAPKNTNGTTGPYDVHRGTVHFFEDLSGFGFLRMFFFTNDRGVYVASQEIDRVELVSLLTDDEPSVYVLDEMVTPPLARQAKRRPLDEFERLGLNAVRFGEELVWTREAPTRMFGAIRAKVDCLECHAHAKEGDLLGAFTYYLNAPVDRLRETTERK